MSNVWVVNTGIGGSPPGVPGSLPGIHGSEHIGSGSDPIPEATDSISGLMSAEDKEKLDEILDNGIVSINEIDSPNGNIDIVAGTGIIVQPVPVSKQVRIIATGEAVIVPHAAEHAADGADPVSPESIGAETPDGAQEKVDLHAVDYTLQVPYAGESTGDPDEYIIAGPEIESLVEGMAVSFKAHQDSTGACTLEWSGTGPKALKKANGSDAVIKEDGIYTVRYCGTNFMLQGEGASGNATASDLLSGKTASVDAGDITGSMPDNGAVTITPTAAEQIIAEGYHNGDGKVKGFEFQPGTWVLKEIPTGNGNSTEYTNVASTLYLKYGGTYRFSFTLAVSHSLVTTAYARIYNKTKEMYVGTERTATTDSFVLYSEDIEIDPGDGIELHAKILNNAYNYVVNDEYFKIKVSETWLVP